jgi:SAM-dependent methyltransferase
MTVRSTLARAREFARTIGHRAGRKDGGSHEEVEALLASNEAVDFVCNLCSAHNRAPARALTREEPSCHGCGSTVRFRAIAHLVVLELLREPIPLPRILRRCRQKGLGLTDAPSYAKPLARRFDYENTYLHTEPRLDITAVPPERHGLYDFVIASDVFEHVAPPVERAFQGARSLLRPGGIFVFTVPFSLEPETVEHFPDLDAWTIKGEGGARRLYNTTRDGREQVFDALTFHGGDGTTLEMRLFSREALLREFARAGFPRVRIASEPYLPFGILWPEPWSVPMVAYGA